MHIMEKNNALAEISKSKSLLKLGQVTATLSYFYRKAMLAYCAIKKRSVRTDVLMGFIRRIEANSSGIRELVRVSIRDNNSKPYFKLPIGLLLRSCLLDSIQGLYISSLQSEDAMYIINGLNLDYVRSLPSRFEVYSDREALKEMGIDELKLSFGLQIEDVFTPYVDLSTINDNAFFAIKKRNGRLNIKTMYSHLREIDAYSDLSQHLYAYFREYSQYEHFSQMGHGDSLVPFDDDSPIISKPYEYISASAEYIVHSSICNREVELLMQAATSNIKKINN